MKVYSRAYAAIDLDAVIHNINELKKRIGEQTDIIAVIKADGYGHGAVPLGREMESIPFVWGYAVATADEAVLLRKGGLKKPILILGAIFPEQYDLIQKYDLRTTIFSYDMAKMLSDSISAEDQNIKIHIKMDTGMSRLGYLPCKESVKEIEQISRLPHIIMEGIFTHFVKADEADKTMTTHQVELFDEMNQMLLKQGITFPIRHISNSAGIIDVDNTSYDLVRAGIVIYGIWPSDEVNKASINLRPVMALKSRIAFLKTIKAGDTVGYGATYQTDREEKIATISFGYADGYPRTMSNKGYVLIRGKKAPIRGRICMDQFMVDVTNIESVCIGDVVTLIGKDENEEITMEEFSRLSGRFYYEIPCILTKRVPRVYYKHNQVIYAEDYFGE